jgi:hypothetical protein
VKGRHPANRRQMSSQMEKVSLAGRQAGRVTKAVRPAGRAREQSGSKSKAN